MGEQVSILDGATFVVSDRRGDVEANPDEVEGLFHRDTRFLSRWQLTVDGGKPDVLSVETTKYFAAQFFLYPPTGTIYENPYLSVMRKRKVGEGFHEDVTLLNHDPKPRMVELRIEAGADFADLFEVKGALAKDGELFGRYAARRSSSAIGATTSYARRGSRRARTPRFARTASSSASSSPRTASGRRAST